MNNLQQGFKVDVLSLRRSDYSLSGTIETIETFLLTELKNINLSI